MEDILQYESKIADTIERAKNKLQVIYYRDIQPGFASRMDEFDTFVSDKFLEENGTIVKKLICRLLVMHGYQLKDSINGIIIDIDKSKLNGEATVDENKAFIPTFNQAFKNSEQIRIPTNGDCSYKDSFEKFILHKDLKRIENDYDYDIFQITLDAKSDTFNDDVNMCLQAYLHLLNGKHLITLIPWIKANRSRLAPVKLIVIHEGDLIFTYKLKIILSKFSMFNTVIEQRLFKQLGVK